MRTGKPDADGLFGEILVCVVVNQVDQVIVLPRLNLPIEMPDDTMLRSVLRRLRCVVEPCEQETASEAPSRRTEGHQFRPHGL